MTPVENPKLLTAVVTSILELSDLSVALLAVSSKAVLS